MEFQWNQKDVAGFTSRMILEESEKYKAWVVESALTKVCLELMAILEAEEEDAALNALPPAPQIIEVQGRNQSKPKHR